MLRIFIFYVFIVFILMGCSTMQQPSNINKVQIKMAHIERNIDENNKQIKEMKYIINELSSQVEGLETYQDSNPIIEVSDDKKVNEKKNYTRTINKESKAKPASKSRKRTGIIRISVSTKTVQQALLNAGYYDGPIDGKIGNKTRNAIRNFQSEHDLTADGIIGQKTWKQMKDYLE